MCGIHSSVQLAQPAAIKLYAYTVFHLRARCLGLSRHRLGSVSRHSLKPLAGTSSGSGRSSMASARIDPDYRANVGICLFRKGLVWVGKRVYPQGDPPRWQMPQGGIDAGETPATAAKRELEEETGVVSASIVAETEGWLHYTFPRGHRQRPGSFIFKGQAQKWFLMRFEGCEDEVRLNLHQQEFSEYAWWPFEEVNEKIVDFKLPVYEIVRQSFEQLILKDSEQ